MSKRESPQKPPQNVRLKDDDSRVIRDKFTHSEMLHNDIRKEFDALKLEKDRIEETAEMYGQMLESERDERKVMESDAIQMLKDIKMKYEMRIHESKREWEKRIHEMRVENEKNCDAIRHGYTNEIEILKLKSQTNVDTFQCDSQKKIEDIKSENEKLLKDLKSKHKKAIDELKKDHEKRIESVERECESKISAVKNNYHENRTETVECKRKYENEIEDMKNEYKKKYNDMKREHELVIEKVKSDHRKEFEVKKKDYDDRVKFINEENEKIVENIKKKYEKQINDKEKDYDNRYAKLKNSYEMKIKDINKQYEESRLEIKMMADDYDKKIEELKRKYEKINEKHLKSDTERNTQMEKKRYEEMQKQCDQRIRYEKEENEKIIENLKKECESRIEKMRAENEKFAVKFESSGSGDRNYMSTDTEIRNLKLDVRMAERKAKDEEEKVKTFIDINRRLRTEIRELKENNSTEKENFKTKDEEIQKLKDQIKKMENESKMRAEDHRIQKVKMEERLKSLEEQCKDVREIHSGRATLQGKYEESNRRYEILNEKVRESEAKNQLLMVEVAALKKELSNRDNSLKKLTKNNEVLKQMCSELEIQADRFRAKYEGSNEQRCALLTSNSDTVNEIKRLEMEIERLKRKFEDQIKDKEQIIDNLEHDILKRDEQIQMGRNKNVVLEAEIKSEHLKFSDYEDRYALQEQHLYTKEENVSHLEARINELENHLIVIKEEAAKHITTIGNLREKNHQLTRALEESMSKGDMMQRRLNDMINEITDKDREYGTETYTSRETMNQQSKLIEFLQSRIETLEKQKKPWFCTTPSKKDTAKVNETLQLEWKDLDCALAEERTKNRHLNECLIKVTEETEQYKEEVFRLRNIINDSKGERKIVNAHLPEASTLPKLPVYATVGKYTSRKSSASRVPIDTSKTAVSIQRHDIPHRFSEGICKRNTKCAACNESIHFGTKISKCTECSAVSHAKCVYALPNNCGLPLELMKHSFNVPLEKMDDLYECEDLCPMEDGEYGAEPSAPPATSPMPPANDSGSSTTTDNNEPDGLYMSRLITCTSDLKEIEDICNDDDRFSFTDSMLEDLENAVSKP